MDVVLIIEQSAQFVTRALISVRVSRLLEIHAFTMLLSEHLGLQTQEPIAVILWRRRLASCSSSFFSNKFPNLPIR